MFAILARIHINNVGLKIVRKDNMMDEITMQQLLSDANLAVNYSRRLPNNSGVQFYLVCGVIVNVFDTGKFSIQGKKQQSVQYLLKLKHSKADRGFKQLDLFDRLAINNQTIISKPGERECIVCRASNNIQIHHIDGNHKNNSVENRIDLCVRCHTELHRNGGYADLTRKVLIGLRAKVDKRREELFGSSKI